MYRISYPIGPRPPTPRAQAVEEGPLTSPSDTQLEPEDSRIERVYARLPRFAQSVALTSQGLRQRRERYGGRFREDLQGYLARERGSDDEVHAVRREKLRRLLRHAADSIPHWSRSFRAAGLDPDLVEGPDDLRVLPLLTKSDVLRLGPDLLWHGAPAKTIRKVHTSGTTGAGLVFVTTAEAIQDQWAVWWRFRRRFGLTMDTWQATFAGRSVVPGWRRDDRPWRTNWAGRQVLFSQYHLGPGTVASYARALARMKLPWFHGYPSFVSTLGSLILDLGLDAPRPATITLGAENVLAIQAKRIREAFGVAPVSQYGLAEMVANASECPAGRWHLDEDFAAVELIPSEGGLVRIVGTSLGNLAMPFIRYDSGDFARVLDRPCGCGLPGRALESIDGREEDFLELADGTRVGRLDHLFKDAVRVAEAQIRQARPGSCTIAIVPRAGFGSADASALLEECRIRFGDRLDVRIEVVESIPRSTRGKLRLVVRNARASGISEREG